MLFVQKAKGYIQSDGYAGLSKDPAIEHLSCMVHARRKFMEVNKADPGL